MEEQLVGLLANTQSPNTTTRSQAEQSLQQLWIDESLPLALVSIASHDSVQIEIRQSALLTLKSYVLATWSPSLEEFKGQVVLGHEPKAKVRDSLFAIATSERADRKIQNAASYVVSKIASADFPDQWGGLLDTLLELIPQASDTRLHGALKVLAELVQDGLDEQQFFQVAQNLVNVLLTVASNDQRKPVLRALAISVLKECFATLEVVIEAHRADVKAFVEKSLTEWIPTFLSVLNAQLGTPPDPATTTERGSSDPYHGLVALKVQVARVLITIRNILPAVISPQTPSLFSAVWDELSRMQPTYQEVYVENDVESRLEDPDGLPYTLDFLVLEDLDFLQSCIRAPPIRKELEKQLQTGNDSQSQTNWMAELIKLAVAYAQITSEEEGMWEIDVNVFLAEEASVTANYTPRISCGDLAIKMGDWLKDAAFEGLLLYSKPLFGENNDWRRQEASLFILDQILHEWQDVNKQINPLLAQGFMELAQHAQRQETSFLRARGYVVAGTLLGSSGETFQAAAANMLDDNLKRIQADPAEVVQVSCIRALKHYLQILPSSRTLPLQPTIIQALQQWVSGKDTNDLTEGDDILIALVETLRDVIILDTRICINGEGLNLLFSMVSQAADNFQVSDLVRETFEEICGQIAQMGHDEYVLLCQKVLPSLTGAFDIGNLTEENALTNLAAELLAHLAKNAPEPLPPGFVAAVMPKLNHVLLAATDDDLLKNSTISVRYMLLHDPEQLLGWQASETDKPGLEVILMIIDRLLGPNIDDNAASEVGGLAAAVVEKAGSERLGPFLMQLLQAVAMRLATAEKSPFIQSLIMVFARLCLSSTRDVVDFLAQVRIGNDNQTGLQVVIPKWLESSGIFVGYDDIRQNVAALSKLYELHDERLAQIQVKGDLIVPDSEVIMTRSKAKKNPDQFTVVPVPLKIVKILAEELLNASGATGDPLSAGLTTNGHGADDAVSVEDEEDGDWEDDLDLGGMSKQDLLAFAEEEPGSARRQGDNETQAFLQGWFRSKGEDPRFQQVFTGLSDHEKEQLRAMS